MTGEALYRFLLAHASRRPNLLLKCQGKHTEWHTRQVTKYQDGRNVTSTETHSETIVDFDFTIDLSSCVLAPGNGSAPIWLVGDKEAAYRGRRKMEVESAPVVVNDDGTHMVDVEVGKPRQWRRRATVSERNASESWSKQREARGLAPWALMRGQIKGMEASVEAEHDRIELAHSTHASGEWYDDSNITAPSKTLRDWSDEYCASNRYLKEFIFRKVVYGWNLPAVRQAVESTIKSNYFGAHAGAGDVHVEFVFEGSKIIIRPDNWFSRMLGRTWVMVLLCVTLIYPFIIWPFKRFGARGGGHWEVAGSAFALNRYTQCPDAIEGEKSEDYRRRKNKEASSSSSAAPKPDLPLLKDTPKGVCQLLGQREGEWFSQWEESIITLVRQRHISDLPIATPVGRVNTAGIGLDGYYPDARS